VRYARRVSPLAVLGRAQISDQAARAGDPAALFLAGVAGCTERRSWGLGSGMFRRRVLESGAQ
jgi:hypothetical protein